MPERCDPDDPRVPADVCAPELDCAPFGAAPAPVCVAGLVPDEVAGAAVAVEVGVEAVVLAPPVEPVESVPEPEPEPPPVEVTPTDGVLTAGVVTLGVLTTGVVTLGTVTLGMVTLGTVTLGAVTAETVAVTSRSGTVFASETLAPRALSAGSGTDGRSGGRDAGTERDASARRDTGATRDRGTALGRVAGGAVADAVMRAVTDGTVVEGLVASPEC